MTTFSPNSSVFGYLLPVTTDASEDIAFDDVVHDYLYGLTTHNPTLIRNRWRTVPGNMPALGTDWISQGVIRHDDDLFSDQVFINGSGTHVTRNQEVIVLVSCYGPNSNTLQSLIRDGSQIAQNRDVLYAQNISLVSVGSPHTTSFLINEQWSYRIDFMITFRRRITKIYPILSLTQAAFDISVDAAPLVVDSNLVTNPLI